MPKRHLDTNISTSRELHTQHKNNLNYGSWAVNEIISNYRDATVIVAEMR